MITLAFVRYLFLHVYSVFVCSSLAYEWYIPILPSLSHYTPLYSTHCIFNYLLVSCQIHEKELFCTCVMVPHMPTFVFPVTKEQLSLECNHFS